MKTPQRAFTSFSAPSSGMRELGVPASVALFGLLLGYLLILRTTGGAVT